MSHSYCIRRRQKGLHLTFEEREELEYVVTQNRRARKFERLTQSQMAQRMGVSKATISRELKWGRVILIDSELREFVNYSAILVRPLFLRCVPKHKKRCKACWTGSKRNWVPDDSGRCF